MESFTKIADALDALKVSQTTVLLLGKTGGGRPSHIRNAALRKKFKVSLKIDSKGYHVSFVESVSAKEQQTAVTKKTKMNNAYQSSKQKDWDPANSLDPLLSGFSLEEKMMSLKTSGGGTFKTQCKISQIRKVSAKCGVEYAQEDHGDYRLVII